jgi:hypothetical protein
MSTSTERMRRMRARRAAAIEADPDTPLRDVDDLIAPAVRQTLAALELDGQGAAVAKLAERYAVTIDRARDPAYAMRWLAPLLLDTLTELGATPMTRAKVKKDTGPREPSALDKLRQARRTYPGA